MYNKTILIEYLAPYLPYELKSIQYAGHLGVRTLISDIKPHNVQNFVDGTTGAIPILNSLNDLTPIIIKDCGYNTKIEFINSIKKQEISVKIWNDLLKNHWDVFGLIEKGLAIDKKKI